MINGYITILDIQDEKTHIYPIYLINDNEVDNFIELKGFNPKIVKYMITDTIKFEIH